MNRAEIATHRRTGSLRAQRALKQAGVDFEAPIDVFDAIERERVWLIFQRLDRLYGAYRRHATPGIVVNSGHPTRLQRFTAAHELGHHLLGHDISVDAQDEVERAGATLPAQEVQAQAFAATFLMPVQLVNRGLAHIGLKRDPRTMTPEQIYRLSLELGSSYAATVTQVRALDRITVNNARQLHKAHPIDIKTDLALGHRPANARADVWPLTETDNGRTLWVTAADEIHASLQESPSSGFRWRPVGADDGVEVLGEEPLRPESDGTSLVYGASRVRHLWWRAIAPTRAAIVAELCRSFEPDASVARFEVAVQIAANPIGDAEQGVSRRQLQLL